MNLGRWAGSALVAAVAVVATAGCGAAAPTTDTDEAAVRGAYESYNAALLGRDFPTACGALVAGGAEKLATAIATKLGRPLAGCAEALGAVYADPQASELLDDASRTSRIESVAVDGDTAVVAYTATSQGRQSPVLAITMHREGGAWKVPVDQGDAAT